ncbi:MULTISPECIES: winged helix-turn-helix domain-containing protein [Halolamina]|uniref:Predicted transcriptional regulator, contains HTH domain n=1 Tax=Halolamina pelagica TaxID=699431 RepID=A0A1I5R8S7_9EURY|nr:MULTISPECIES: winged helix-turn-helix domain-containing protein [Halolamina]NHX35742.1 winged helix-turn-helix transcriptional regulator [Halolamina sp. R1-12]SFP54919.1 Predicted transcriptional regulator, contains HTH domain [Halolamina pelagica]
MTESDSVREIIDVLAERTEYLRVLSEDRRQPHEIAAELSASRSTVSRVLRRLREHDLVEKRAGGYAVTPKGELLTQRYLSYVSSVRSIDQAGDVLRALPEGETIDAEFVASATVNDTSDAPPFQSLDAVSELLDDGDRIRAYLPTPTGPHLLQRLREQSTSGVSLDLLLTPDLLSSIQSYQPDLIEGMATARTASVGSVDGPTYGLFVTAERAATLVYTDDGAVQGALWTDDDAAVDWAESRYDELARAAADRTVELRESQAAPTEAASSPDD